MAARLKYTITIWRRTARLLLPGAAACLLAIFASGCREEAISAPPPERPAERPAASRLGAEEAPKQAQPKLQTMPLYVGSQEISAELAVTFDQIRTGMMWRTNMAEMEGMLFVFARPNQVSFYMKNTLLPLTCAYIDSDGVILELHDMKPLDETSIPSSSQRIQYVLEMNQGWFQRHNVTTGMVVTTPHGPLRQAFFRR